MNSFQVVVWLRLGAGAHMVNLFMLHGHSISAGRQAFLYR
jgi:hypothetical protein